MKSLRLRLTLFILSVAAAGAAIGAVLSFLYRNGILGPAGQQESLLFSGFRLIDLLVIVLMSATAVALCVLMSRVTANPIEAISKGMSEVARGNFDVSVKIKRKTEEYARLTANFNTMAARLKENEYLTKNFSANVSHEFRTPIAIINGYAKLLEDPETDEATRRECVGYIVAETERLSQMTENLLCISRLDTGKQHPAFAPFALDEQLRRTVLQLEPRWQSRQILPELELQPCRCIGCGDLLAQVWYNLIDNAIKFTPSGGHIRIALQKSTDCLTVTVADDGIGMDRATAEKAFTQFYRGENARSEAGSGLGLPLSRKIVSLHEGTITLQSAPGKGTVFCVRLPGSSQ